LEARQEGTIRTVLDTSQREVDEIKTVPPPKFNTQLKEKGEDFPCSKEGNERKEQFSDRIEAKGPRREKGKWTLRHLEKENPPARLCFLLL
jgi:hypothetical protein